ncbi:MAG: DNA polymerase III subunit delta' [Xenococcaceae cyanobacterium]
MNSFAQLIGQNQAVELLGQAVAHNRIAPAYLFAGPPGVGRCLAAKCFSELLICAGIPVEQRPRIQKRLLAGNHPDLFWVEPTYLHQGKRLSASEAAAAGLKRKAPPQIRIEQIREITQFLGRPPLEASRSVVVIEDAQRMAEAAANALLKTLEEPGRATLILIAPGTDSLLPTLVSRCQRIPFYRLASEDMKRVLRERGYEEILEHPALLAIAQGSPGEAIASLAQRQAIPEDLLGKLTQPPTSPRNALGLAKEIDKKLDTEAQLWLVDYLQYCYWHSWRQKSIIEQLEKARQFLLSYAQPRLVWECTLLYMCQEPILEKNYSR